MVTNNDESHVLTPGKMNQRQGKEGHLTPTKELHPPSFSPGAVHGHGKEHLINVMECQARYSYVSLLQHFATNVFSSIPGYRVLKVKFASNIWKSLNVETDSGPSK